MKLNTDKLPFHFTHTNIIEKKLDDALDYIEDSNEPFFLKSAKEQALVSVYKIGVSYLHSGIRLNWVIRFLNKKQELIFSALSEQELNEIVGITVKSKRFYVPEEEIILITLASQIGNVNKKTQEHFIKLCNEYMVV